MHTVYKNQRIAMRENSMHIINRSSKFEIVMRQEDTERERMKRNTVQLNVSIFSVISAFNSLCHTSVVIIVSFLPLRFWLVDAVCAYRRTQHKTSWNHRSNSPVAFCHVRFFLLTFCSFVDFFVCVCVSPTIHWCQEQQKLCRRKWTQKKKQATI